MNLKNFKLLVFIFLLIHCLAVGATNNYLLIKLPHNVSVELPRNWKAISNNNLITLDSSVQARMEGIGMFDAASDLNFGANYYDENGKTAAIFNIRYYPNLDLTQTDASTATATDIQELDNALKSGLIQSSQVSGFSILKWFGTSKETINGSVGFVTEYERSPLKNNGNFRVRLIRIFNGSNSFTITVSYRAEQEYLLRPICNRIISSIKS